ncbi:unnamed protein product [Gongylonema pulchrum]|uniref:Uncharacterized protein n=1 Tax=Gongylonema pulchrum TaxID=637853 RepID=A0A183DLH2_9BILA|nr:unnamed protein product [Gongylonema pulchrum]
MMPQQQQQQQMQQGQSQNQQPQQQQQQQQQQPSNSNASNSQQHQFQAPPHFITGLQNSIWAPAETGADDVRYTHHSQSSSNLQPMQRVCIYVIFLSKFKFHSICLLSRRGRDICKELGFDSILSAPFAQ